MFLKSEIIWKENENEEEEITTKQPREQPTSSRQNVCGLSHKISRSNQSMCYHKDIAKCLNVLACAMNHVNKIKVLAIQNHKNLFEPRSQKENGERLQNFSAISRSSCISMKSQSKTSRKKPMSETIRKMRPCRHLLRRQSSFSDKKKLQRETRQLIVKEMREVA